MDKCIKRNNKRIDIRLIICIGDLLLILGKMYFLNNIFLVLAIAIMSLAIIIDKEENKPLYLFFSLPLIYVMKFSNNQISLYTILCILYFLSMIYKYIKEGKKIDLATFVFLGAIAMLISINAVFSKNFNVYSSASWFLNLVIFYFIMKNIKNSEVYEKYVFYFAISIAIVGVCGIIFMNNTNISIYLDNMRRTNTVIANGELNYRYSGFDLDPNYFALQSLIAFWCLLISNKIKNKYNYILLLILLAVGISTISKMYIITLIISVVIYIIFNAYNLVKISIGKIILVILFAIISFVIINKYIIPVYESRFDNVKNIDDLTTGRSDIWKEYINQISNNLKILFIGEGIGNGYLYGHASHSTYILIVYRLGIVGSILFIGFILTIMKNIKINIWSIYNIPLLVLMITNFALDIFDFDSFPYLLVLILGVYCIKRE